MDSYNQVHVQSLETLERLALRLAASSARIDTVCDQALRESCFRLEEANAAYEVSISKVEAAADEVGRCQSDVSECEVSSVSAGDGSTEEDGDWGGYEDGGLSEALSCLESAKDALALAEEELEVARHNREVAMRAHEATSAAVLSTRDHLENNLQAGIELLNRKIEQLREYLLDRTDLAGASPAGAANFSRAWLGWRPPAGAVIRQPLLAGRFSVPHAALADLARKWSREDPSLSRQIATLRERHSRAGTPEELEAVRMASRRGASGRLGELLAEAALQPMARSIQTQRRTTTGDDAAHVTITDIVLRGLRMPVNVGKLQLPAGADASVEVKCGRASYLKQQLTHMERQVAGHHGEHASFCFLSRDFRELDRTSKSEIAKTLGKKRSKIYAILPEKRTLDSLVWEQITSH